MRRLLFLAFLTMLCLGVGLLVSCGGDDDDENDDDDDDDELFEPLDHVSRAFDLVEEAIASKAEEPELVALVEIVSPTSDPQSPLDQQDFTWTYKLYVHYGDDADNNMDFTVLFQPEESIEKTCEGTYAECGPLEIYYLREVGDEDVEGWDSVTVGLAEMIATATPQVGFDVYAVSISRPLDPDIEFIAYWLLDESGHVEAWVNAETGEYDQP